jgi:hypothetical protein
MKKDTPIALAVATYGDRGTAVNDFDRVMDAKRGGSFDHVAVGVVTKGTDGKVQIERHDSTAKHLAWGGALIGGAMFVVAPPLAPAALGLGGAPVPLAWRVPVASQGTSGTTSLRTHCAR